MGKPAAKLLLDDGDGDLNIRVNEDYARRFEHNKRREEWHKLEERNPALAARLQRKAESDAIRALSRSTAEGVDDEDEEEDSSEDEEPDPQELAADTDKVLETLLRIRRQDPLIYQKDVRFFPEEEEQEEEEEEDGEEGAGKAKSKQQKGDKPMYLRTVLAQQALAEDGQGAKGSSSEEEEEEGRQRGPRLHSYVAEQDELKKAFLEAAEEAAGGSDGAQEKPALDALGGVLRKRKRAGAAGEEGAASGDHEQQVTKLLDEVFGRDESTMDAADRFLKAFIANKAWVDASEAGGRLPTYGEVVGEEEEGEGQPLDAAALEEDEQFLEEADRYEAQYNFRFEEPGADRIITHPRTIGDSVRKADERRRRQREAKAARKAAEREELEAQLKRMKNLKKQEIEDKLREVTKVAGLNLDEADTPATATAAAGKAKAKGGSSGGMPDTQLLAELMAEDFDPEEYDRRMAAAFDDEYYDMEDDEDVLFGDGEEQLAALSDLEASGSGEEAEEEEEGADGQPGGWRALRAKLQQEQRQEGASSGSDEDEEEEEEGGEGDKEARRAALAEKRSQLQRLVEEYYKLDYEDNIGGIPCRFRYKEVPKTNYLSPQEILLLDDKELNQIMSLKKLAPYRDDVTKVRPNYKALEAAKGSLPSQPAWKKAKALKEQQQQQRRPAWRMEREGDGSQPQEGPAHESNEEQQQEGGGGGDPTQQQQGRKQHSSKHQQQQRSHSGPSRQHGSNYSKHHKQQQQKGGGTRLDPEARQQARLDSYAKLSLKRDRPSGDHKQQQKQAGSWQQRPRKKQRKDAAAAPPEGRLAKVAVDVSGLTPAQKKNLKRALKRKESKGQAP